MTGRERYIYCIAVPQEDAKGPYMMIPELHLDTLMLKEDAWEVCNMMNELFSHIPNFEFVVLNTYTYEGRWRASKLGETNGSYP